MSAQRSPARSDPRVLETREALGDALVALIGEQPFDSITVQRILTRAGVARSTFYTHYKDKNDLFLSDAEDFFSLGSTLLTRRGAPPERLAPVKELFAHLLDVREFYRALRSSGKLGDVLAMGRGFFARSIAERLQLAGIQESGPEAAAKAHALAGSLFALLDWWVDSGMKADPQAMDELFHRMAWSGLGASCGEPEPLP